MTRGEGRSEVVVIGGGLAGISAAIDLAEADFAVTLLEARPWLGGATCSFARRGITIDNGQHVFLRCCTAYRDLLARLGTLDLCAVQGRLDLAVLGPDAQLIVRRPELPAPLHLAAALAGYRLLSPAQRVRAATATTALLLTHGTGRWSRRTRRRSRELCFGDWLARHGQDDDARMLFWDVLSVSALGLTTEHADLAMAASAIRRVVLGGRAAADIGVPAVPLSKLHTAPAAALLGRLGARVRLGVKVAGIRVAARGGYDIRLDSHAQSADGLSSGAAVLDTRTALTGGPEIVHAAGVVLAVPAWTAAAIAPAELTDIAAPWGQLEPSPVVSLHVIYGSRVTELPFAAVTGSPVRWVIDKTRPAGLHSGQYLAACMPAADRYVDWPAPRLGAEMLPELERLFPAAAEADVADFFVTRERRSVFRQVPGAQRLRAQPVTGLPGLVVAGAWTDTGWPDTMEGAVRSGRLAALKVQQELRTGRQGSSELMVEVAETAGEDPTANAAPAGSFALRG